AALRMALQTREQHIRREKATSNVCTAQVLLAVMASMYAVYHGPEGIRAIAEQVHGRTARLAAALRARGLALASDGFFDTLVVNTDVSTATGIHAAARKRGINLRAVSPTQVGVSLDETTSEKDLQDLLEVFGAADPSARPTPQPSDRPSAIPTSHARTSPYLTHPVFRSHRSETEMLRYIRRLEARDLSLTAAMIP